MFLVQDLRPLGPRGCLVLELGDVMMMCLVQELHPLKASRGSDVRRVGGEWISRVPPTYSQKTNSGSVVPTVSCLIMSLGFVFYSFKLPT